MAKTNDYMLESDRRLLAMRFEEGRRKWEKARRYGMMFHVIVRWSLMFGGGMTLAELFLHHYTDRLSVHQAIQATIFTLVISTIYGIWDWRRNEKRYRGRAL